MPVAANTGERSSHISVFGTEGAAKQFTYWRKFQPMLFPQVIKALEKTKRVKSASGDAEKPSDDSSELVMFHETSSELKAEINNNGISPMTETTDNRREVQCFVDSYWSLKGIYYRIEGWCSLRGEKFESAHLIDDSNTRYNLIGSKSVSRPDVTEYLEESEGLFGFELTFELDSSNRVKSKNISESKSDVSLEVVFKSGLSRTYELKNTTKKPLSELVLSDEIQNISDDALGCLIASGATPARNIRQSENYVDQVIRFENWLLIKGWTPEPDVLHESLRICFEGNNIDVIKLFFARYYRPDIPSPSCKSVFGSQSGFAILVQVSDVTSHCGKLTCRVYPHENDALDFYSESIMINTFTVPKNGVEYHEFLSNVIDFFSHTDTLAGPSQELVEILDKSLTLDDQVDAVALNTIAPIVEKFNTRKSVKNPSRISLVINTIDKPRDSLYSIFGNSRLTSEGGTCVYICCARKQLDVGFLKDIEKLAYLFNVEITPIVYGSFVSQGKISRDSVKFTKTDWIVFVQSYSAIDLTDINFNTASSVIPAIVHTRRDQPTYYGISENKDKIFLNRRVEDFSSTSNIHSFYGTLIHRNVLQRGAASLYSLTVVDFMKYAKDAVAKTIKIAECPKYIAYEAIDDPESLYRLYRDWHSFHELKTRSKQKLTGSGAVI